MKFLLVASSLLTIALVSTATAAPAVHDAPPSERTPAGARAFVEAAEQDLTESSLIANRAGWINVTYVNDDSDALATYFGTIATEKGVRLAKQAAEWRQATGLDPSTARKLDLLRGSLTLAAPETAGSATELNRLATRLQSNYAKGRARLGGKTLTGDEVEALMGSTRDPQKLAEMWKSWHEVTGRPMRQDYARMVEIANAGARQLGYSDTGAMWRSRFDMSPQEFEAMYDRLLFELKPLYEQLHCYTRTKLNQKYGGAVQPDHSAIRADLLGNMWAQEWGNIYDIVAPAGVGDIGYDLADLLAANKYDAVRMVKAGEGFYTSLGLAPLPESFYTRSQFTRPRDREVVCHASAANIDAKDDLRIKMCIRGTADDFVTIHHELGHNYYQRSYNQQSYLYQDGANDGFHEAIGDFVALSITPEYLAQIGLLDRASIPDPDKDIGLLLKQAMDKVAFMPFAYVVDKWRWGVFDGSITPANYNQAWVELKRKYQGIEPSAARSEADFDPGAKFHVPGNTTYERYFLARVLQFQFYKAACDMAGWKGPLHRCSFYGNEQVGQRLNAMLATGKSQPWPATLEAFTGTKEISGKPMLEYFAPLSTWLERQNRGKQCGW